MTFPYQKINPQIIRPIIPVIIKYKDSFLATTTLIDSGADYCIFDLGIAKNLGINFAKKDETAFRGIGKSKGYFSTIELQIGKNCYPTKVVFANIKDLGHSLLGQKGFFDQFKVSLDYKNQKIEITP